MADAPPMGTITVVYPKADATGDRIALDLTIKESKSLSVDHYHVPILACAKQNPSHQRREESFSMNSGIAKSHKFNTFGWVISDLLSRSGASQDNKLPSWAGFKSLVSENKPLNNVGALHMSGQLC